jgi:hypothetical protein
MPCSAIEELSDAGWTELGMSLFETTKKIVEKLSGQGRPDHRQARAVRQRKPHKFAFADDGLTPNNPDLPLILYRSPVRLAESLDPAAVFEELFGLNGWRDGIYDYAHYHPGIHEVIGIARGRAMVQFAG